MYDSIAQLKIEKDRSYKFIVRFDGVIKLKVQIACRLSPLCHRPPYRGDVWDLYFLYKLCILFSLRHAYVILTLTSGSIHVYDGPLDESYSCIYKKVTKKKPNEEKKVKMYIHVMKIVNVPI